MAEDDALQGVYQGNLVADKSNYVFHHLQYLIIEKSDNI